MGAFGIAGFLLAACSQVPEWADPTSVFFDSGGEANRVSLGQGLDDAPEGFPSLGSVPDAPSRLPSRMAERQELLRQLEEDRRAARYTAPQDGAPEASAAEEEEEELERVSRQQAQASEAEEDLQRALDREEQRRREEASGIPVMRPSERGEPVELPVGFQAGRGAIQSEGTAIHPAVLRPAASERGIARDQAAGQPLAVIHFPHGAAGLDAEARRVLRQVASLPAARDGRLRIVGHASSRTGVMDIASHWATNLEMSMSRADIVAAELRHLGLDAENLLVEAAGDGQPIYHEFMATGEAGNRRVEIFAED